MTKEEIIKASVAYNERQGKLSVFGGSAILSDEEYYTFNQNPDFIAGAQWQKDQFIEKACDAYCKVCGHYHHSTHVYMCRGICEYYSQFVKAMKGE